MKKINKKIFGLCLAFLIPICLSGCMESSENSEDAGISDNSKIALDKDKDVAISINGVQEDPDFSFSDFSNLQFWFESGAGAWATELTVASDGSFEGDYHDSDMGNIDSEAPNGVCYMSNFKGKFTKPVKIDEYTYSTTIAEITYAEDPGSEEVADGVRYLYSEAQGLSPAKEIMIYLPGTSIKQLPEAYLEWITPIAVDDTCTELPFYGIYNVEDEDGFYSTTLNQDEISDNSDDSSNEIELIEQKYAELSDKLANTEMNQGEMNDTAYQEYKLWDDELNLIWGKLKEQLDEETMKSLTEKQRTWVTFKETQIKEAGAEYEGGSIQPLIKNEKAAELTRQRVYELQDFLQK